MRDTYFSALTVSFIESEIPSRDNFPNVGNPSRLTVVQPKLSWGVPDLGQTGPDKTSGPSQIQRIKTMALTFPYWEIKFVFIITSTWNKLISKRWSSVDPPKQIYRSRWLLPCPIYTIFSSLVAPSTVTPRWSRPWTLKPTCNLILIPLRLYCAGGVRTRSKG